jgi:hypothetical protein
MPKYSAFRLASKVQQLIEEDRSPRCDGCLALLFGTSLFEARRAALMVANDLGFERQQGICQLCNRQFELTSVTVKVRRPKRNGR